MIRPGDGIADWIVGEPLGRGGMGHVFRCRHRDNPRLEAALKVLLPHELGDARMRFAREVEALFSLRHPSVVRVNQWGEDTERGVLWMVMELVRGQTIDDHLDRTDRSPERVRRLAVQAADALAHAHTHGIVHRDVKPANMMVTDHGRLVLLDFGIAVDEKWTQLTETGVLPGTLEYISPEVFRGAERLDPILGDVYGLGQVIYEGLVGRPAFRVPESVPSHQRMVHVLGAKVRTEALDPGPQVPQPLREAVIAATEPDPTRRLQTIAELRDRLREEARPRPAAGVQAAAVGGGLQTHGASPVAPGPSPNVAPPPPRSQTQPTLEPGLRRPPPPPPPSTPEPAGGRRWLGLAAAVLLVGAVGIGTLAWQASTEATPTPAQPRVQEAPAAAVEAATPPEASEEAFEDSQAADERRQAEEVRERREKAEAAQRLAEQQEADREAAKQRRAAEKRAQRREAARVEAERKEAERKEAERKEAERKEAERKEAERQAEAAADPWGATPARTSGPVIIYGTLGAKVYIDDKLIGPIPVSTTLAAGTYTFTVVQEGTFYKVRKTISFEGVSGTLTFTLTPQ